MTDDLPDGVVARIDVTVNGVRVNLREGMSAKAFADMLRLIAAAFEDGTMGRRYPPDAGTPGQPQA